MRDVGSKLQVIYDQLGDIQMELHSYGILLSGLYEHESLEGTDFYGAGMAIRKRANELARITQELDELILGLNGAV